MTDPENQVFETVSDVLRTVIRTAADGLFATESAALDDLPDGVHQHRTHVRRLRSVLAGFRRYLDESAVHALRAQLGGWGAELGVVRDAEVRAQVAAAALAELGIHDAGVRIRLVDAEWTEYRLAHARLRELRDTPRGSARAAAIASFADDPPMTRDAEADASDLSGAARHEARRVLRAAKHSDGSIESLHELRKAGRRLRYVCEALHAASPSLFGPAFADLAAAGEEVHDALGDHRDEHIFLHTLAIARAHAGRDGERIEPYDVLARRAAERAGRRLDDLGGALRRVREAAKAL